MIKYLIGLVVFIIFLTPIMIHIFSRSSEESNVLVSLEDKKYNVICFSPKYERRAFYCFKKSDLTNSCEFPQHNN